MAMSTRRGKPRDPLREQFWRCTIADQAHSELTIKAYCRRNEEVIPCGVRVRPGDVVGRLHDFQRIDEPGWPSLAPIEGVVVSQSWGTRVHKGQFIVYVGEEQPW
jgi:hypothetical protein